jgi:hypothetical protein
MRKTTVSGMEVKLSDLPPRKTCKDCGQRKAAGCKKDCGSGPGEARCTCCQCDSEKEVDDDSGKQDGD